MRLETERLILRPVEESDVTVLHPLIDDADVAGYLLNVPTPYSKAALAAWIHWAVDCVARGERYEFAVVLRETGLPIGACGLMDISWESMYAEFGYWLGKMYWGQGLMSEAARRLVRFAFEEVGLDLIHARVLAANTRSARIVEKVGFTFDYHARGELIRDDESLDVMHYSLARKDYRP